MQSVPRMKMSFCGIYSKLSQKSYQSKIPSNLVRNFHSMVQKTRSRPFLHHQTTPLRNKSSMSDRNAEFRRLLQLALPERYRLGAALGLLAVSSAVTMSVPFALGRVIDIIYNLDQLKDKDEASQKSVIQDRLKTVCLALCGVFVVGGLCNFGRIYLMRISGQNIAANLRTKVFGSIVTQETAFFDLNKTGELVNRLSADTQLVSQTVTQQVSDGSRSVLMTVAGVGMMFFMSPQLALVGLSIVPPVAAYGVFMGRRVKGVSRELQDSLAASTELAEEKLSNIRTVRTFAMEKREVDSYKQRIEKVQEVAVREALLQAKFYGVTGLSGNMIILTVLYYGGSLVTSDILTVGNLASFVLYSAYVGIGMSGVSTFYAEMMKGLGASSRLWYLIDRQPVIPTVGGIIPHCPPSGHIKFNNVNFSYPTREDMPVLQGLDLEIKPNTVVAVVGASGCGKSTVGSLLLRLYDPVSGGISIDGEDIKNLDPSFLRTSIGVVSQEPVLFSATIGQNIGYGSPGGPESVSQEEIERAAREANAHEFISQFPDGYNTLVGERGVLLSGGQKQRVAIARAILKQPAILLLDEATSALDSKSEYEVKIALDRIMKGRSVVTIAHRLSTIQTADQIAVLDQGKVVEIGTYNQLVNKEGGKFAELVKQQTGIKR